MGREGAWGDWLVAANDLRSAVPGEMDDGVRKAGMFNLYNGLVIHAKLVFGHPTSLAKRGTFFNLAAYVVCGVRVSSGDLEHQVLRCKATGKSVFVPLRLAVKDPRMHFVLNCGSRSCPPVRAIRFDEAEEDIVAATVYFIHKHVIVEGRRVTLSRLWKWFRGDFTPDSTRTQSLLAWISGNAPPDVREMLLPLLSAMGGNDDMDGGEVHDETSGTSAEVKSDQPRSPKNSKVRIKFQRYDWYVCSLFSSGQWLTRNMGDVHLSTPHLLLGQWHSTSADLTFSSSHFSLLGRTTEIGTPRPMTVSCISMMLASLLTSNSVEFSLGIEKLHCLIYYRLVLCPGLFASNSSRWRQYFHYFNEKLTASPEAGDVVDGLRPCDVLAER